MNLLKAIPVVLIFPLCAQTFTDRELKTTIDEVTIYLQGGLVTRSGKLQIPSGKSLLRVKSLSPHIDAKSIQVKAIGDFTVLSVNHKINYLDELQKDDRIKSLLLKREEIALDIAKSEARLEVLVEKQSLLNENKNLGGQNSGASLAQIKQAIDFYDKELTSIKAEEISTKTKLKRLNEQRNRIDREVADVQNQKELPTGEIEIRVEANSISTGEFEISYLVGNTGWYPKYDIRVTSIDQPLVLNYKADIYQNTGVDWEEVKLKLSNGDPNLSGVAPELNTWYLNYARNTVVSRSNGVISNAVRNVSGKVLDQDGEPLPGATIIVKGTTIGTVTDLEGNYSLTLPNGATHLDVSYIGFSSKEVAITSESLNIRMDPDMTELEEVVVVGYSGANRRALTGSVSGVNRSRPKPAEVITTTTIENQTTVEIEVDDLYSVKSNGEKLSVNLREFEIETLYQYYAIPKLDKDAFLIARIVDWNQYNLLEGEANLYFEDRFVGRSILDARSLEDTLDISLGRDKSIVIGREKVDDYTKRRTLGANKIESRGFKILARNNKSQSVKLTLLDQIPIAAISDISITATELSAGKLNEKTGEVIWELELSPKQQADFQLGYEVKYPKYEKVYLE